MSLARLTQLGSRIVVDRVEADPTREATFEAGFDWMLLRGLPVGEIPDTPSHYGVQLSSHVTDDLIPRLAKNLGVLIGYPEERAGALIQDIYPVAADAAKSINSGSSVEFDFHTENAHLLRPPRYVGFYCLRSDPGARAFTYVAKVGDVCNAIDSKTLAILREPLFVTRPGLSFTRTGRSELSPPRHSILEEASSGLAWRFNLHNTVAVGYDAGYGAQALSALASTLRMTCSRFLLEAGDLLVLDNRTIAHGRSTFNPRFDGSDRWFRRFYIE